MAVSKANKRTKGQKEIDRKDVTDYYVKGMSLRNIAKKISDRRPYSLSHQQIKNDLDAVFKDLRKYSVQKLEDQKLIEIQKINKVEFHAWEQFDKTESAKFLELVLKCIEKRCKIFGIDQQDGPTDNRSLIFVNLPSQLSKEQISQEFNNFEILKDGE